MNKRRIVVGIDSPQADSSMTVRLYEPRRSDSGAVRIDARELDEVIKLAGSLAITNSNKAVEACGDALFSLLKKHPGFEKGVLPELLHDGDEEPFYLYFEHPVPTLEALPWEALYTQSVGFLSQVRNYAIARVVSTPARNSVWLFEPPLRIMAVLGASGPRDTRDNVCARSQWAGLRNAVLSERQLPCQVHVLTCDDALAKEIASENLPWASTTIIINGSQLLGTIRGFRPNILHFFCHGRAAPVPQLEIATRGNWIRKEPGSIVLEGRHLGQNTGDAAWLVALNCCESSKASTPLASPIATPLASTIVSYGVPVVVGMREPIDAGVANSFSRLFYQNLLEELNRCIVSAEENGHSDVHWACGMFRVRQSLSDAGGPLDWTMPVMHTRLENFHLKLGARLPAVAQPATGKAPRLARKPRLPEEQVRELCEEARQLQEDRDLLSDNAAVASMIDRQLGRVEKLIEKNRSSAWTTHSNSPAAWKLMLTLAAGMAIGWKAGSARRH